MAAPKTFRGERDCPKCGTTCGYVPMKNVRYDVGVRIVTYRCPNKDCGNVFGERWEMQPILIDEEWDVPQ